MSLTIIDRIVSMFPLYGIDCICFTGMTIPVIFFPAIVKNLRLINLHKSQYKFMNIK